MNRPFLSIITINFNNAEGLKKTVQSVISQSFENFEFIIIDGDSTDESQEIVNSYKKYFSYWVSEIDTGIYNAMNKGIAAASGNYLLFLNSGDLFTEKTALEDFTNHANFKGDVIYGDYKFENGEKIYPDDLYPAYFMKTSLPHQSTFFKSSVFEKMGNYDEKFRIGADRAFYIKCYLSGKIKFQHVKYFLTLFDLSGMSNDPEFLIRKKKEDELLLKEQYGSNYQKYRDELDLEIKQRTSRRNSIPGLIKRIKNRIRKLWARH